MTTREKKRLTVALGIVLVALIAIACNPEFLVEVRLDEDCPDAIPIVSYVDAENLAATGSLNILCPYAYVNSLGDTVLVNPIPQP